MPLQITKMLVPASKYYLKCPNAMSPIGVTVHETGNIATAMSEISYMIGNNYEVSYHFAVDDVRAVQGLPLNRNGWHAGDSSRGRGNARTIGVEHCYNWTGGRTTKNNTKYNALYQKTVSNGVELVAQLFIQYPQWGIPEAGKNIWRHKDQSGKNCPQRMIEEGTWNTYVARVKARYLELKGGKVSVSFDGTYTVKSGDTLWGIANANKTTVANIKSLNGLKSDVINIGQKLKLSATVSKPAPAKPAPVKPKPAPAKPTGDSITKGIQKNVGTEADGWDGKNTRHGVKRLFQRGVGANDDGIIGKNSLAKAPVIRKGSEGWHVYALQAMLYLKGYKVVGEPDRKAGKNTIEGIKQFQRDNSLSVDGEAGRNVYGRLFA